MLVLRVRPFGRPRGLCEQLRAAVLVSQTASAWNDLGHKVLTIIAMARPTRPRAGTSPTPMPRDPIDKINWRPANRGHSRAPVHARSTHWSPSFM